MVLDGKQIAYEIVDISSSEDAKNKMREIVGDPKALPPQIANGDQHCGVSYELIFPFIVKDSKAPFSKFFCY